MLLLGITLVGCGSNTGDSKDSVTTCSQENSEGYSLEMKLYATDDLINTADMTAAAPLPEGLTEEQKEYILEQAKQEMLGLDLENIEGVVVTSEIGADNKVSVKANIDFNKVDTSESNSLFGSTDARGLKSVTEGLKDSGFTCQ